MINSDILLSVLIDDDYEKLSDLIANVTDLTFHKTSNKYKYPIFLESSEGAPLLFIAAYFGSRQCYEYLLNEQSDIPNFKYSLLTYACAGGNMSIVRDVASRFPIEFNKLGISFKGNPGFQAVRHGNLDVIKWLLLKDYKFESEEIFEACLLGYYEIFNFLFENVDYYKAKLEIYDDMIISSCLGGNDKILQKLLNEYPCKKCSKKKYQSFINYSIEKGNISCLKCLLSNSKKFFPRISESFIQPSLEYASNFEFIDIIVFLVKHGGNYNDLSMQNAPLINALTSDSESTACFYLDRLPKIPDDIIIQYFTRIFSTFYSFQNMNKTLFDMKELLSQLAIQFDVDCFFDDLIENKINLDFLTIELFDNYSDNSPLFMKLFDLGAPFQFNKKNKVFLFALKEGNQEFIDYAISKGAFLNDEIIEASGCMNYGSRFYRKEDLINLLFKYNIDISRYPNFLEALITLCGSKIYIYEKLALEAVEKGAVITKNAFIATIKAKWESLFRTMVDKNYYFQVETGDISLNECRFNRYSYENILRMIFEKQPQLVDELFKKINSENYATNISALVKNYKEEQQKSALSQNQYHFLFDMEENIDLSDDFFYD